MLKRRIYGRLAAIGIKNKKDIKKKSLSFFLVITVACFGISLSPLMVNYVRAVDVTWVGGVGGDWCTDANWSNGVEPTSADNVTVSSGGLLDVTTSGCVTEGHSINFNILTIGDGFNANTLTLSANIGTGTDIIIKGFAILTQDNTATQTISGTLNVESGGLLTHSENPATHSYEVDFQAATIVIAGSVNLDERGHMGGLISGDGNGTGKGLYDVASGNGSGGAHSGNGGATASNPASVAGGVAYCNNNNPSTLGSGGGGSDGTVGGDGGGLAMLKATVSITVSGTITANGGTPTVLGPPPATGSGGGGAGAIKLDAPVVDISGSTINVVGGSSNTVDQGGGGGGGCVFISYSTSYTATGATTSTAGGTGANNGGAGSFISNALPTITTPSASQTSASIITATTTITDLDKNITSMIVEYSMDNITWVSSTLANVTQDGSGDGVTTSTGQITGIDTNNGTGSQSLTIQWNVGVDVPNTDDTSVYLRFIPADSIGNGATSSSIAFAVDTKNPTVPGALSVNSTSTISADLNFGSATVDTGFSEYKIFYSTATPVTVSDSSITSSTDADLGVINFNGAVTTTIPSLAINTLYYANIWAYDTWGRSASSTSEVSFYTLTSVPSGVAAVADGSTVITVSWSGSGTQYYTENITAGTNSGWTSSANASFSGLTAGETYSFRVKAKNGDGVETGWSGTVSAKTAGGNAPIPNPPGGGGGDPPPPQCTGEECQPKEPTGQVGGYVLINGDAEKTTGVNVNLNLFFTKFVSTYAVIEANAQLVCDFAGKSFGDIGAGDVFNENYNTKAVPFLLSAELGSKKVCVKYRGSLDGGKSFVDYSAFDTIILAEIFEPKPPVQDNPPEEPAEQPTEQPIEAPTQTPTEQPTQQPPANPQSEPAGSGESQRSSGGTSGGTPSLPAQDTGPGIVETAATVSSTMKDITETMSIAMVKPVVAAIKQVVDNPKVEKVNEIAVAPAIILAGAANVAVGFNAAQVLLFLRHIFTQPFLLLRLRKRKSWGVIYNALNKMPVDLAVVRLVDESTGRIVQSQVTDAQGRYLITVEPGEYHLEVDKQGFSGFSKLLKNKDEDAKFIHLYHGGKFQITETETESVLNFNIPLDPVDEIKGNNLIIREHTKRAAQNIICVIGLIASVLSFIISPKLIIFAFVLLHVFFYWLFYRFSHRKITAGSFGSVTEMIMEEPIGKAVVRVFDSMYNKLVDTTVTDRKGRYAVLVGPSKYYTTYEKEGFEKKQSEVLDFSSEKTNGMGGLINRDEELKKVDKLSGKD